MPNISKRNVMKRPAIDVRMFQTYEKTEGEYVILSAVLQVIYAEFTRRETASIESCILNVT